MKRITIRTLSGILMIALTLSMLTFSALAGSAGKTIRVTLPTFDITVNGVKYDSANSEYPFLVYNNITYMPMTTDFAEFMGMTIVFESFYYLHGADLVFYAGGGERKSEVLGQYIKGTPNTAPYYEALIPEYHIYIQETQSEIDNENTLYPVFNYGGITYLPLTFDIMYHRLDWEYTFNHIDGLVINSTNAVRPHDNYNELGRRWHQWAKLYHYDRNRYIRYEHSLGNETIKYESSLGIKTYSLKDQLDGNIVYLDAVADNGVSGPLRSAFFVGEVLNIRCIIRNGDNLVNAWIEIDLNTGEVISCEEIPKTQEEPK